MIIIYPEQLKYQVAKKIFSCYFLIGDDPFLIQESKQIILDSLKRQEYGEYFNIAIDSKTNLNQLLRYYYSLNLFSTRKVLILNFSKNILSITIEAYLLSIFNFIHKDILFIICLNAIDQHNKKFLKNFNTPSLMVSCHTLNQQELLHWITNRTRIMDLNINHEGLKLLCEYYEGNLSALSSILKQLSFIYATEILTKFHIEKIISNSSYFKPFHWINALLLGDIKRAIHIAHQLKKENAEVINILLRYLQKVVLKLIYLHRNKEKTPLDILLSQQSIISMQRALFLQALKRLHISSLTHAIHLLTDLEIILKKNHNYNAWPALEKFSLLLCNKPVPINFLNV